MRDRATLDDPVQIGRILLPNRLVLAPMSRMRSDSSGVPGGDTARYYGRYAKHGVSLIITEATYVDAQASRAYFDQPGMCSDAHAGAWQQVAAKVHENGGRILLQLQHAGRLAEPGLHSVALGPTTSPAAGKSWQRGLPYTSPAQASTADLEDVAQAFATAARRALEVGFDGVEIHGARGYLIDQFLSASTNTRADEYGGASLTSRLSFPLEVVRMVREALGAGPLLSFNLSLYKMDDVQYSPPGGVSEVQEISAALESAGVDLLHVSSRRALAPLPLLGDRLLADIAAEPLRRARLIAGGGIASLDAANELLATGCCDLVSVGRLLAANPDLLSRSEPPRRYERGHEREIVRDDEAL